ncbi:MAG: hypothetical protein AAF791_01635 [Bacteroidota bacterium]
MPEKRFTEEEAQRIFARVAERQHLAREGEPGLTLAEMQEVARASGLDPALVTAVATEMVTGTEADDPATFGGIPLTVRMTRVLPVDVDEDGWALIVTELRRAFGRPGTPTDLGRIREWTATPVGHSAPVHVTLTPGEGTATLTMEQSVADQARGAGWILPGTTLPLAAIAGILQATTEAGAEVWLLPVLVGALAVLILGAMWLTWRHWERKATREFERAMDRIDLAARGAALASVPPDETSREAPALSLGDLPEAESTEASRTRDRARS